MQTTLLGLGIAVILALLAALVGPFFVDWGEYRTVFEARASRMIGAPVRINGAIDARLLPTPSLVLRKIEIDTGAAGGLKAEELAVELALGPLITNQWRASELRLVSPDFQIDIGERGQVTLAEMPLAADADAVSIDRIAVESGRATIIDKATSSRLVLEKFWFNGDVRSLAGPIKGEGGFITGNERFGYRLSTGRLGPDGIRIKLALDPSERALTFEGDGILRRENNVPKFEGAVTLARSGGVALAAGRAVSSEPWRATSQAKLTTLGALFDQIDLQYGQEDRAIKLTGSADFRFGNNARIDAVMSARHVDLDRVLALPEAKRRLPLLALQSFAEGFSGLLQPPARVRLGVGIDAITLAGASVQALQGDFRYENDAWEMTRLEFRAPGATQMRTSGRIAFSQQGTTFTGPAFIEANDPKGLVAWLEGRGEPTPSPVRSLKAGGNVILGGDRIVIDELRAEIDRKLTTGRLAYGWRTENRPARLDADLNAAELDLDQAAAFLRTALAGTKLEMPKEMALALDIGVATIGGIEARDTKAKFKIDGDALALEQVSVADLGGAALRLSGAITSPLTDPRGTLSLDVEARAFNGLVSAVNIISPAIADGLRPVLPLLAPAKLRATLAVAPGVPRGASKATLAMTGRAGPTRLEVTTEATGSLAELQNADVTLRGRIESEDGAAFAALFDLDKFVGLEKRLAVLAFSATGKPSGDMRLDARITAAGFDGTAKGSARLGDEAGMKTRLDASFSAADVKLFQRAAASDRLPVSAKARLDLSHNVLSVSDLSGNVAGTPVRGTLNLVLGRPARVTGSLEADALNAAALIAGAVGMPASVQGNSNLPWTAEPFGRGVFSDFAGQVDVKAGRASFSPGLIVRQLRALARFDEKEVKFDDVEGAFAGGRFTGQVTFQLGGQEVAAQGRLALTKVDATALSPAGFTRPPVSGRLTLQSEFSGAGRTAAALLGSLRGAGTLTVEDAQLAGLSPRAFASAIQSIDKGSSVDAAKVHDMVRAALDTGRLAVPRIDGAFTISAGQARWGNVIAHAEGADLAISGLIDLADASVDARLTLSQSATAEESAAGRADVLILLGGPIATPQRVIDVSSLTGWLTLRAVDRQARQVEALQAERDRAAAAAAERDRAAAAAAAAARIAAPPKDSELRPAAIRVIPPAETNPRPPEVSAPPPANAAPGPRSEVLPPVVTPETAPPLSAPIEIRPAPNARGQSVTKKTSRKSDSFFDVPPLRAEPQRIEPPADLVPAPNRRSIIDSLFGPLR